MKAWQRWLVRLGVVPPTSAPFQRQMWSALERVRVAELQIAEATTLEQLDLGRTNLIAGWAEVQRVIRLAKEARGIALRPLSESERMYQMLRDRLAGRSPGKRGGRARVAARRA